MSHLEIPMYLHLVFVILKLNLTFFWIIWNSENTVYLKLEILRLQKYQVQTRKTQISSTNIYGVRTNHMTLTVSIFSFFAGPGIPTMWHWVFVFQMLSLILAQKSWKTKNNEWRKHMSAFPTLHYRIK